MQGCNEIIIDIDKLIKYKVTSEQYILLYLLYTNKRGLISKYKIIRGRYEESIFTDLIQKGYLIDANFSINNEGLTLYTSDLLVPTDKFEQDFLLKKVKIVDNTKDWFDQWYELWPKGVKTGGYAVRSGRQSSLAKMMNFVRKYPEYNKDIIMAATKKYIEDCKKTNYSHMKLSHYFIDKDKVSVLASCCENLPYDNNNSSQQGNTEAI